MSSFLEKLFILITADASEVESSTKLAKKSTDELSKSLTTNDALSQKMGDGLNNVARSLRNTIASYFAVKTIVSSIFSVASERMGLGRLSQSLNLNIEELDAWGKVVKNSGGSTELFQESVKGLSTDLTELSIRGRSRLLPFFQALGVKVTDSKGKIRGVMDILPQLADQFQKMNPQQAFGIGQKLGIDEGTIALLQQGRKSIDELIRKEKELGVTTQEQAHQAKEFSTAWIKLKSVFKDSSSSLAGVTLPSLTKVFNAIEKGYRFIIGHSDFVRIAFLTLAAAITVYLLPALIRTAIAAAITFGPLYLLIGGLALLALIAEDVYKYLTGQNSLLGELAKKYPIVGQAVSGLVEIFKVLWSIGSAAIQGLIDLLPSLGDLAGEVGTAFISMGSVIRDIFLGLVSIITAAIDKIKGAINWITAAYGKVSTVFGGGTDETQVPLLAKSKYEIDLSKNSRFNSQLPNTFNSTKQANSTNNQISIGDVTIQTQATDAPGIARDFKSALVPQIRHAMNDFDDGVAI